jgi:hypothetical protein
VFCELKIVNWFVVVYKLILLGFIIFVFSMLCGFSANWVSVCVLEAFKEPFACQNLGIFKSF